MKVRPTALQNTQYIYKRQNMTKYERKHLETWVKPALRLIALDIFLGSASASRKDTLLRHVDTCMFR